MQITKLQEMLEEAKKRPKKRLVVAYANDLHTIEAVDEAISMDIVTATLTGDENNIKRLCAEAGIDHTRFEIIHETSDIEAGLKCCDMINKGYGNIIMKGTLSTDNYMRCILNKERGIMVGKSILTHVSVIEPNGFGKLLIVGDVAVIPQPDIAQKVAIVKHLISTAHSLGNEMPKVGLLAATEKVSYKIPSCVDAALIAKMADRGEIKGALVDGPLALDGLIDKESCEFKGIK
ncbi:MAG TPA: phosphate acyltransferase, partial [Candidatus Cloacimonadota bacterium]|nr:phosphate acyltransferase [Candidatus Cloacimonadota bacterium]